MIEIVKRIAKIHNYNITSKYWGRIGSIEKRYGQETVLKALDNFEPDEVPLTILLNKVEKRCQYIITEGELDDLAEELLG